MERPSKQGVEPLFDYKYAFLFRREPPGLIQGSPFATVSPSEAGNGQTLLWQGGEPWFIEYHLSYKVSVNFKAFVGLPLASRRLFWDAFIQMTP